LDWPYWHAYSKAPDAYFKDLGSNLLINLGSGGSLTDKPRDIFGADQASGATENLAGGSKADRLYGGGGMDILNGYIGAKCLCPRKNRHRITQPTRSIAP